MYKSTGELIKGELTNNILKPIYNIFEDSIEIYRELVEKENDLFKGVYRQEFDGRLINFIIKRYFDIDKIPKTFPFNVNAVNMAYGQKRTELKRNNILLTLGKTQTPNSLPPKSKYKLDYSRGNYSIGKQITFNIDKEGALEDIPYYGILTYGIWDNTLKFLNIVIPDSSYNHVIDNIPLTSSLKLVVTSKEEEEERFFQKESITKEAQKLIERNQLKEGIESE